MKILVTGCAGFIGSNISERLLKLGHEVIGVDNFDVYYSRSQKEKNLLPILLHPHFRLVEDNLATMPLIKVIKGINAVVHLAAQPGVRNSWGASFQKYVTNNLLVTQRLLEETKGYRLKKFVYASSSSVYGQITGKLNEEMKLQPKSPYGVTKLAAEHLCDLYHHEYKMPTLSLRFFSVYGPKQRPDMAFHKFCHAISNELPLTIYGNGQQIRDFTFVDDVTDIVVEALGNDLCGETINVGGGTACTLLDAIAILEGFYGKPSMKTFLERQKGDVESTQADTAKLEKFFSKKPSTSLIDGLALEWKWFHEFLNAENQEQAIKNDRPDSQRQKPS
jgi:UDP-glucose 4-epimerase